VTQVDLDRLDLLDADTRDDGQSAALDVGLFSTASGLDTCDVKGEEVAQVAAQGSAQLVDGVVDVLQASKQIDILGVPGVLDTCE
jgi:hypothetical protein